MPRASAALLRKKAGKAGKAGEAPGRRPGPRLKEVVSGKAHGALPHAPSGEMISPEPPRFRLAVLPLRRPSAGRSAGAGRGALSGVRLRGGWEAGAGRPGRRCSGCPVSAGVCCRTRLRWPTPVRPLPDSREQGRISGWWGARAEGRAVFQQRLPACSFDRVSTIRRGRPVFWSSFRAPGDSVAFARSGRRTNRRRSACLPSAAGMQAPRPFEGPELIGDGAGSVSSLSGRWRLIGIDFLARCVAPAREKGRGYGKDIADPRGRMDLQRR